MLKYSGPYSEASQSSTARSSRAGAMPNCQHVSASFCAFAEGHGAAAAAPGACTSYVRAAGAVPASPEPPPCCAPSGAASCVALAGCSHTSPSLHCSSPLGPRRPVTPMKVMAPPCITTVSSGRASPTSTSHVSTFLWMRHSGCSGSSAFTHSPSNGEGMPLGGLAALALVEARDLELRRSPPPPTPPPPLLRKARMMCRGRPPRRLSRRAWYACRLQARMCTRSAISADSKRGASLEWDSRTTTSMSSAVWPGNLLTTSSSGIQPSLPHNSCSKAL
mmetsp:Transcript_36613/g.105501  ORF Transcript_36613/g.105501 Transcript_36613/m.105501 type:complete len:277 (+) Transcript_36613:165-995(+)